MTQTEEKVSILNQGRRASLMLNELSPLLVKQQEAVLARLKNMYRDGSFTETKLVSGIAELCTLEDIVNTLQQQIHQSESIQKELNNGRRD